MRLQDLLKQQRQQHQLTQGQLAAQLFVSAQAVSKWERGQTVPTIDNLLALADLYNVSLDELVQGSPFFKKPRVIGHRYQRGHVAIFMISWLIGSLLLSHFELKTWSIFLIMLLFISSYLVPLMTQDYWVITQTGFKWRHYESGWQLLLAKQPPLRQMPYTEMQQVTLRYRTRQRLSIADFNPDYFKLIVTLKSGQVIALDVDTHVREWLPQLVAFLDRHHIVALLLTNKSLAPRCTIKKVVSIRKFALGRLFSYADAFSASAC